MKWKKRK